MADIPRNTPYRVLIVDDEIGITDLFVPLMADFGYDARAAGDGEDALKIIPLFQPDIVVSDIHMVKIDGDELYRLVVKDTPSYSDRFIFITGNEMDAKLRKFLAETKCTLVTKPFDALELTAIIESKLGNA